jgi:hypothetical protein
MTQPERRLDLFRLTGAAAFPRFAAIEAYLVVSVAAAQTQIPLLALAVASVLRTGLSAAQTFRTTR